MLLAGLVHTEPTEPLRKLTVDAGRSDSVIRSFQGVSGIPKGRPPGRVDFGGLPRDGPDLRQRWRDAHVDIVRSYIWQARLDTVDNPDSLFPKWDADPNAESSYNFVFADTAVAATRDIGADIIFTVTSSIPANNKPPANIAKWAEVVRHIVLHYQNSWSNGMAGAIRFWEIGDDPDVNTLHFDGTPAQYYSMYAAASAAIKSVDPRLQVGGPGLGFPLNVNAPFREGFLDFVKSQGLPLDFFSWQWYADGTEDPLDMTRISRVVRQVLAGHGFATTPQFAPDWNFYGNRSHAPDQMVKAAYQSATLTYLQESDLMRATLYRGDAAMGPPEKPDLELTTRMFNADGTPMKSGSAFYAVGKMLETPQRLPVAGGDDHGFAILAGRNAANDTVQILLTNYAIDPKRLEPTTKQNSNTIYLSSIILC